MCYTGKCNYEDFHGTCNGVPSHCCPNIILGRGELKLKKVEEKIKSIKLIKGELKTPEVSIDMDLENMPF